MPEPTEGRVAVYIDFDNIVISRYGKVHGSKFRNEKLKDITAVQVAAEPLLAKRLKEATVDVGAILDYASSFGLVTVSRAYADWSTFVNADYRGQLIDRAVDLVQLFPTTQSLKNGADIRLAIDVIEDLFRLPDITHVVVVAGDSDYIAVAQRVRRLNRYVVGIGVADSSSPSLAAACNEFAYYENLPGLDDEDDDEPEAVEVIPAEITDEAPEPVTQTQAHKPAAASGETRAVERRRRVEGSLCRTRADQAPRLILQREVAGPLDLHEVLAVTAQRRRGTGFGECSEDPPDRARRESSGPKSHQNQVVPRTGGLSN